MTKLEMGQSVNLAYRPHERYGKPRERMSSIESIETFRRTIAQESAIIMDLNEAFTAHNSVRSGAPIPGRNAR